MRTDTPIPRRYDECAKRFGAEILADTLNVEGEDWLQWLFESVAAPPPLHADDPDDPNIVVRGKSQFIQLAYLQPSQLRQALL